VFLWNVSQVLDDEKRRVFVLSRVMREDNIGDYKGTKACTRCKGIG
jgi:hypothetical protein